MPAPTTTGAKMGYASTVDTGQVTPAIISNDAAAFSGAITIVLVSGRVLCYAFELQASTVILGGKWYMGSTVTGTTSIGIYTLNGSSSTLVSGSDSGVQTNAASQVNTFTYGTPVSLSPGQYLMALACSNGTDTYLAKSLAGNSLSQRMRIGANSLSAGALPSTTGALTATANLPAFSLTVQGGL